MKIKLDIRPLSINQAWQGRRYKTKKYTQYCQDVSYLLGKYNQTTINDYCEITYKFYLKNWKMTDGDNCVKCLQDILVKKQVIKDDRFIMRYVIEKIPSEKDYIEIEINNIEKKGQNQ